MPVPGLPGGLLFCLTQPREYEYDSCSGAGDFDDLRQACLMVFLSFIHLVASFA